MSAADNFNPHSHKGSDRIQGPGRSDQENFNPHSHKGSDSIADRFFNRLGISIHTPTRGVTVCGYRCGQLVAKFQSTLPQGE